MRMGPRPQVGGNWQSLPLVHAWMLTRCTESIEGGFLLDDHSLRLLPYRDGSLRLPTPTAGAVRSKWDEIPSCCIVGVVPSEQAQPSIPRLFSMRVCV